MKRKILVAIMSIIMTLTFMPAAAFADTEGGSTSTPATSTSVATADELAAALANGGNIQITESFTVGQQFDIVKDATITASKDVTLTRAADFLDDIFVVKDGAVLYLGSSTGGKITLDGNNVADVYGQLIDLKTGAVVVAENIEANNNLEMVPPADSEAGNGHGGAVYVHEACAFVAKDSSFSGNQCKDNGGAIYVNDGKAILDGVTFTGNKANSPKYGGGAIYSTGGIIDISNSTFEGNNAYNGGAVGLYSGTVGRVYNTAFGSSTNGNSAVYRGGAVYLSSEKTSVNLYSCTFEKNTSVNYGGGIAFTSDTRGNLYDISFNNNSGSSGSAAWIYKCATAPIVYGCTVNGAAASTDTTNIRVSAPNPTYYAADSATSYIDAGIPENPFKSLTISPIADQKYMGSEIVPSIEVKSGDTPLTTDDFDVAYSQNDTTGTGKVVVVGKGNHAGMAMATFAIVEPDAKINDTRYKTLKEAIDAVQEGETITLLNDVTTGGISVDSGKNFVLDFNGKTVTFNKPGTGSTGTATLGLQLLKDSTIEFKNGTIKIDESNKDLTWSKDSTEKGIAMLIQNYANLTMTDMIVDGSNIAHNNVAERYVMSNNCGAVTLDGKTNITAAAGDFAFDTCKYGTYDAPAVSFGKTFTGTVTGNVELTGGKLDIAAGTFKGSFIEGTGYEAGQVAISGGSYTTDVNAYCTENFEAVQKADGTYGVEETKAALQGEVEVLTEKLSAAEENITSLQSDLTTAQGDIEQLESDLDAATSRVSALEAEIAKAGDGGVQGLVDELKAAQSNVTALQLALGAALGRLSDAEAGLADLTGALDDANLEITALETEVAKAGEGGVQGLVDTLKALNTTVTELSGKLTEASEKLAFAEEQIADLNKTVADQSKAITELGESGGAQTEELNALKEENTAQKAEIAALQDAILTMQANTVLTVSAATTFDTISLTWNANPYATAYIVSNGADEAVTIAADTTTYTFTGLKTGTAYNCSVKSVVGEKQGVEYAVTATPKLAKAKVATFKNSTTKAVKATWKKVAGAQKYQIQIATNKKFTLGKKASTFKSTKATVSKTFKKLKKGKTYYTRVRAIRVVDGKSVYGAWSAVKSCKIKK